MSGGKKRNGKENQKAEAKQRNKKEEWSRGCLKERNNDCETKKSGKAREQTTEAEEEIS